MARKITVVDCTQPQEGGSYTLRIVHWLDVPASLVVQLPGATSEVTNATATELQALAAGTVLEVAEDVDIPLATTVAQIQAKLESRYARYQADLQARAQAKRYVGYTWDGVSWTKQ